MGFFGVVYEGDTEYGHYQVADTVYAGRPARVLYSGNNDAAQSGIAKDNDETLLFDYNQRFLEIFRGVRPSNILILGGGAFTLPIALMKEFPNLIIDVVELDPDLLDIAEKYFEFTPSSNVRVHISDGRRYLDNHQQKYDMIVVDVFSHDAIPDAFQSSDFITSVAQHGKKCNVFHKQIIAPITQLRSAL
jgi:hypothetical protein